MEQMRLDGEGPQSRGHHMTADQALTIAHAVVLSDGLAR
jgi:hypothetical protein